MLLLRFLPILFLFSSLAQGAAPSGETWFTLQSPHFRVHHTAPLEIYARAFTRALEAGLPLLEKDMNWRPATPIDIVIMDPSDSANGFAVNFPNTHIEVYSMPFESDTTLGHYVNWVNELAVHELTHIVSNDMSRGVYSFFRTIFGSWVKPNGLQPVWWSEGLAVFEETSHTTGGRGRSPLMEAMVRTAFAEGILNSTDYSSIDRFNDGNPWWPGGNLAYFFGYAIQALPTISNPGLPGKTTYENSNNFPFSPNMALEESGNTTWASVWDQASARLMARYPAPNAPKTESCRLTNSGAFTGGQAISPDGYIYFTEQDWNHGQHFARVKADAPCGQAEVERLYHKNESGPTQVAVSPDGKHAAFAAYDRMLLDRFFSDIYLYNAEKDSTDRLTDGARVRDPAFANNETLLYVKTRPDTSEAIVRRSLQDEKEMEIFVSQPLERISGLFARGDQAVFSLHKNNGQERVQTISLASGKTGPAFAGPVATRAYERNPFLAADGSIYFAAAYDNSTQEIYRFDPRTKSLTKVAKSRAGFVDRPLLLADGKTLVYQEYGRNGLDLVRATALSEPPKPEAPAEDLHQFLSGEAPPRSEPSVAESNYPSVPYSAFSTPAISLWPQYWIPDVVAAVDGALIGASTSGNDPLDYHSYALTAQYDTRANFPTYLAYYMNRVHLVNFLFRANQYNDYFTSSKSSNRIAAYSGQIIAPIGESAYSLGAAYQERALFGVRVHNVTVFQSFNHSEFGKKPAAIAPNYGHYVNLYVGLYPNSRTENFFADLRPSLVGYLPGFHPSHSISLAAQVGISTNTFLSSNYYLGGGTTGVSSSAFTVRGYPSDILFGQRIATFNFSYSLPLAHPYRGFGTKPLFLKTIGLRFLGDAGAANYLARYRNEKFYFYSREKFGKRWVGGVGSDLLFQGSIFYHIPVTLITGYHYGFDKGRGGDSVFNFGLSVGGLGPLGGHPESHF